MSLQKRLDRLEGLAHVTASGDAPPERRFDPDHMGAVLNILCDCQHLDRALGCYQVLTTIVNPLPHELAQAMATEFHTFVARGGAKDFRAFLAGFPDEACR